MGKFEKLVVLTVLFLTAIVLAISLRGDDVEAGTDPTGSGEEGIEVATDPSGKASETTVPRGVLEPAPSPETDGRRPGLLLDSPIRGEKDAASAPPSVPAEAPAAPPGPVRILVNETGLQPAAFGDYMVYTVRAGDTWAGLAQRFFRNTSLVEQLRSANEEMVRPLAGEDVLIPVFDFSQDAGKRAPLRPAAIAERTVGKDLRPTPEPEAAAPAVDIGKATSYVVVDGDNLSKISAKVYGTPHRWKEIYDANQNVLDSPDWVQVGMKLRIQR